MNNDDALRCSDYLQEGQLVSVQLQDPDDSEDAMTTFSGILGLIFALVSRVLVRSCTFVGGAVG